MKSKKLLVADDSLTIQKVIRLALASEGYEIHAVSDGIEAVEQISLFQPDVVLIDVGIPGKSAFEIKAEYEANPAVPASLSNPVKFILMSSAFEPLDEKKVTAHRFEGRLIKPFDPAHLRSAIQDVLKGTPASPKNALLHSAGEPSLSENNPRKPLLKSASPATNDKDTDIRELTEATVKISGLDHFEWEINEPVASGKPVVTEKTKTTDFKQLNDHEFMKLEQEDPSLSPPKNMFDTQGVTFEFEPISATSGLPPEDAEINLGPPDINEAFPVETTDPGLERPLSRQKTLSSIPALPASTPLPTFDELKIEGLIERWTKEHLPRIAERVIREEIHKLLSNPPK